jgi:hypothetical protein
MKNKIITTIILTLLFSIYTNAQIKLENSKYEISIGRGSSFYNNIQSEQFLVFFKIPNLNGNFGKISYEGDVNFEYILENNKTTYLAGFVPMFRYEANILNANLFIKAGIGTNYLSQTRIGSRSLGGHFIFSDMLSIGSRIIYTKNFSVEISYLIRHISNAGIYNSNEGFNSQYLIISLII